jgi:hypothetical protein
MGKFSGHFPTESKDFAAGKGKENHDEWKKTKNSPLVYHFCVSPQIIEELEIPNLCLN